MFTRRLIQLAPDAPAKAAGAPPPPTPAPAAVPAPAAPSGGDNAFAEIDAAFTKAGDVEPPAGTPPKEPTTPKPEPAAAPAKPAAAAAPPSPKPPEPKPGDVQRTPKELRAELERTKAEFETHKATTAQLEAKIKDYEAKGKDTDALRALVESRDKELETIRGEIRALKQEASPEFKAKYDVPFNLAAKYAENVMKGIVKTDGAPADFDRDFVPLYRMPFNAARNCLGTNWPWRSCTRFKSCRNWTLNGGKRSRKKSAVGPKSRNRRTACASSNGNKSRL